MKINSLDTKVFLEGLEIVGNAIPNKSPLTALTGINLKADKDNDRIILLGSDSEMSIKKVINGYTDNGANFIIEESGDVLVDFRMLKLIIGKLDCPTITLYSTATQLIIGNETSNYKLNLMQKDMYPNIEFKKLDNEIDIDLAKLKKIISNTTFACSNDEKRPILTGVNFSFNCEELKCVATDSFRLARVKILLENKANENVNFTFPKKSLMALEKIIAKSKQENIKILYDNNNGVLINTDNTLYKTRLLDGNYPNTSRLINNDCSLICRINRNKFVSVIDRISIFSTTIKEKEFNAQVVNLKFLKDNILEVYCQGNQSGNAKEVINCECGFDLDIACSVNYLLEALKSFDDEIINLNMFGEVRPFYLTSDSDAETLQLVLPVRRNN